MNFKPAQGLSEKTRPAKRHEEVQFSLFPTALVVALLFFSPAWVFAGFPVSWIMAPLPPIVFFVGLVLIDVF